MQIQILSTPVNDEAKDGDLTLLISLHEQGHEFTNGTTFNAVRYGHLHIIKYLHKHEVRFINYIDHAAAYGQLECLRYLHENGCSLTEDTFTQAALGGHLDCVKYLHENGCPWNEWIVINTLFKAHHLALQQAMNVSTYSSEKLNGHIDCLEYLNA
jgi:hypothetical protein